MIDRLAIAIAGSVVAVAVQTSATATAVPLDCEHRGAGHWESHGRLEDDRYHLARGERITCHDNGVSGADASRGGSSDPPRSKDEPREDHAGDDRTEHHLPGHDTHRWWRND